MGGFNVSGVLQNGNSNVANVMQTTILPNP